MKSCIKRFKVVSNEEVKENFYKLKFLAPEISKLSEPGQFVHIKVSDSLDPLLRRPFSIFDVSDDGFEILYKIVGRGTEVLKTVMPGDDLDVFGPLGNGYKTVQGKKPAIVAGGVGIASLFAYAKSVRKKSPLVFIGAETESNLLCDDELRSIGIEVFTSTEDGSVGYRGVVIDLFMRVMERRSEMDKIAIFACGPVGMMKEICSLSKKRNIPSQLSLESYMGCGLGVCLGCAVRSTDGGYRRVCKDGPVFSVDEVIL